MLVVTMKFSLWVILVSTTLLEKVAASLSDSVLSRLYFRGLASKGSTDTRAAVYSKVQTVGAQALDN